MCAQLCVHSCSRFHSTGVRMVNCRKDYLQKISTEIVKNHDIIGMEDLKVSSMLKAKHYAKAISEVSWAAFRTMIGGLLFDKHRIKKE